jgi:hypothetical protein
MRLLQVILILVAMAVYLGYQLLVKKKKPAELTPDIAALLFFVLIWGAIYYWIKN